MGKLLIEGNFNDLGEQTEVTGCVKCENVKPEHIARFIAQTISDLDERYGNIVNLISMELLLHRLESLFT